MAPAPSKKRKTNVNDDDSRTIGKLLDVVIKHVGLLNGRMNKMEDKLDESLKLCREKASAGDDLMMKLELLAEGQTYLLQEDRAACASSAASSSTESPRQIGYVAPRPTMHYTSLFTGKMNEGILWGTRIGLVFFRQLTTNPYPTETELLETLLEHRGGILKGDVKAWFASHRVRIRTAFRDKRCSYTRTVKTHIAQIMEVEALPTNSTSGATKKWRTECAASWIAMKDDAVSNGLSYPSEVTEIAFCIAQLWDKSGRYTKELLPYERSEEDNETDDCTVSSIVTLEALTLLCCEVTFCLVDVTLSEAVCGSECLDAAVSAVLQQRVKVELNAAAAAIEAAQSDSDSQ